MPFNFSDTGIAGLKIIDPVVFDDDRGFFLESFKKSDFVRNGIAVDFVQDNHSFSGKNVLRGLHFQRPPFQQAKLVRVITGCVWDVAVDLRKDSPTYLKWVGVKLSSENRRMFFIPEGFAHGFVTLSDSVHLCYKCSNEYSQQHDGGIRWDDPGIGIEWPVENCLLSEKDASLPFLTEKGEIV